MAALDTILTALHTRHRDLTRPYHVPGLWIDFQNPAARAVNPYSFYADRIVAILTGQPLPLVQGSGTGGDWTRHAVIYNLFPRVTTAYDHAHDGVLSCDPSPDGWRDTGTLLKCMVLLPYLRHLGINTVHLLPITTVGQDGKKGTLGSPYGIRNPYELDPTLDEPALGLGAEPLFAGFVEAAHRLGMRVVMEFVLRTASKDGDWIGQHPEWFYWVRADVPDREPGSADPAAYGSPVFSPGDLAIITDKVLRRDFHQLPAPTPGYRALFAPPPRADQVRMEGGRWIGVLDDGTRVRVPGAFADWPPDDTQPPWTDVTYLRMYDHPDFNYIAYNTLRMYDQRLARPDNAVHGLWDAITGVIPHYQQDYGIDGVMIDMGHALPAALKQRIVRAARSLNPDFAFWDEDFTIGPGSVEEGYNAVMGYLIFDLHVPDKLRDFLHRMAGERLALPFFATPENHNTPRAAAREAPLQYVHYALVLSVLLPGVPFIHSGFELMEAKPINTGLTFTPEMIEENPPETLPLFSEWAFGWTRPHNLVGSVRYALNLRQRYQALLSSADPATFFVGYSDNANFLVFARQDEQHTLVAVANTNFETEEVGRAFLPVYECDLKPLWGADVVYKSFGALHINARLGGGHVLLLEGGPDYPRLKK